MMANMEKITEPAELREQEHRELLSYLWGLVGALVLTLLPFALVRWKAMSWRPLAIVLGVSAFLQVIVHLRLFLHVGAKGKRDELQLVLFTGLMLIVMVGGTIWVMSNLATRMMMGG